MSARMTVVAIRATGHVLGALTERAPGLELTVAAVAGAAMPVQAGTTAFAVPAGASWPWPAWPSTPGYSTILTVRGCCSQRRRTSRRPWPSSTAVRMAS